MNTSGWVVVILIVLVLAGGGWWWYSSQAPVDTNTPAGTTDGTGQTGTNAGVGVGVGVGAPMSAAVSYGANGFSPAEVTVKKGGTVTWSNQGSGTMWVASAQHPTHTAYAGTSLSQHCDDATDTSFDQCKSGSSYSFTFNKAGTWAYHNHSNSSHFGRVLVVE